MITTPTFIRFHPFFSIPTLPYSRNFFFTEVDTSSKRRTPKGLGLEFDSEEVPMTWMVFEVQNWKTNMKDNEKWGWVKT